MHYCAMIKWIFVASAAIFSLCVVETLKVQISGDVKTMTQKDILRAHKSQSELNKVVSTPAALPKSSEKLDPGKCHLRVLLARTKASKEFPNPEWETAQQAEVGSDGKYKFDFEVSDPDNVGTQYTWGFAADSRIFELQNLSKEPMTLRVLKTTTKKIHIYASILHTFNNGAVDGIKLELVKLVDPTMAKDLQSQYCQTMQITAKQVKIHSSEEEPEQEQNPNPDDRKALRDETATQEKGKAPADGKAGGHHITEQDQYIEIEQLLSDVLSKLSLAKNLFDHGDFMGDLFLTYCNKGTEQVQELADEITHHHDMNVGNMKEKAKSVLIHFDALKHTYQYLVKTDKRETHSYILIGEYVNIIIENGHKILEMMNGLPDPKRPKFGSH